MAQPKTRYAVAGELGKGGFGVVYLLKGDNGVKLALKTVDLRRVPEDFRERAKDEAKILQSLRHRHLVHHVNSYLRHPYLCIITEFCEGGDLDKFIGTLGFRSGLPERLIVVWLMQTASALNYMHTHSPAVLHRDLKPQNIYVTGRGDLRLGDLGLARKLQGPADMATTQVGTILYLSPEIISGQPYNSKKLPLPDKYSSELRGLITNMLIKDPRHRPSASAILASPVVNEFLANPQTPSEIITDQAVRSGRHPPKLSRDLSGLRNAWSAPLKPEDILVPADAEQILADVDKGDTAALSPPRPLPSPPPLSQGVRGLNLDPAQTVQGMSTNSMVLFGEEEQEQVGGGDGGAVGGSDSDPDTFYDSQTQPELGEEHLLLQIQQFQSDCIKGLGSEILEAAYGVIGNVRNQSDLEKELKGLLGEDMYPQFGRKILQLRALEYGLQKTTRKSSRTESLQPKGSRCDVM